MRRSAVTLVAALSSLGLAACSAATPAPAPASQASVASSDAYTGNVVINCNNRPPVELNVLRPGDEADTTVPDFQSAFPCIKLKVTEVPFSQLNQKIQVLAASSAPPDVYYYDGPSTATYAYNQILLPIDQYLDDTQRANILDSTIKEGTYDGKLYSAGMGQSALALYYNKDMTDAAGITVPTTLDKAWTWEEAIAAFAKAQQGPAGNPTVYGLAPSSFGDGRPGNFYRDGIMLRSMGDPTAAKDSTAYKTFQGISDDGATVDGYVNSPEAVQAATVFQSMFGPNAITPKTGTPDAFLNGKAAFDINLYQESVDLTGKKKAKFNWGIAPMPYFKTPLVHTGSDTIGVSAKTKHPEEAAAYALFATSKAEQEKFFQNGGTPILKDFYQDSPVFAKYPVKIFADELDQWGQPRPTSPAFAQYDDQMTTALNNIALGADPQSTLDDAARKIDKQLQSVR